MKPQRFSIDTTVRVREHHRIAERRGMVGTIVGHYGGDGYMAVDVRFSDRLRWLLWPEDLEEITSPGHGGIRLCNQKPRPHRLAGIALRRVF
jgi:hypothetical protein